MAHINSCGRHRQRGVALIMALVFLLLLTILGITTMGTTSLEEKMAGNVKDKNLAFQASEAAAIVGETWLSTQLAEPQPNTAAGIYQFDSTTSTWIWDSVNWSGTSNLDVYPNMPFQTVSGGLAKVQTQPKYIIEVLAHVPEQGGSLVLPQYTNRNDTILRVTARGTGGTDAAVAMVQTIYKKAY